MVKNKTPSVFKKIKIFYLVLWETGVFDYNVPSVLMRWILSETGGPYAAGADGWKVK